jgi:hypothetical protein
MVKENVDQRPEAVKTMRLSEREQRLIEAVRRAEPESRIMGDLIRIAETHIKAGELAKSAGYDSVKDAAAALSRETYDLTDHRIVAR